MTTPPTDPRTVCSGFIKGDPARYPSALYRGQTVYFCLHACRRAFEQDPDGFVAGEIPHSTEEDDERTTN